MVKQTLFFKQQNIIKVANKLKTIAGDGDITKYDECQKILEDALSIGRRVSNVTRPLQSIDDDLSPDSTISIPTGIDRLDEILGGGLDKGKVGIIICPMGAGKTSLTTCFSANAATTLNKYNNYKGFKVLQIIFEDDESDIHRKYMSKITQIESKDLRKNKETIETVKGILETSEERHLINDNIRIMELDTGEVSASDIEELIKKITNQGFKPDMVVVDYFECVKPENGTLKSDITEKEGTTMRKFEKIAKKLGIALWIPTQGNRTSINAEVNGNENVGGSIKKPQIAQVVLSIARTQDDLNNNRATISINKNRTGKAGAALNGIYFNNGTCTVKVENLIEFDTILAYNEYAQQEEEKRKMIQEAMKMTEHEDA